MEAQKVSREDAEHFKKHGVELWEYFTGDGPEEAGALYVETDKGHMEEFYNEESTFIYYVIEGEGSFHLDREEHPVAEGDIVYVPPETRTYYLGDMELLLFVTPPWTPEQEVHVRDIDEELADD